MIHPFVREWMAYAHSVRDGLRPEDNSQVQSCKGLVYEREEQGIFCVLDGKTARDTCLLIGKVGWN